MHDILSVRDFSGPDRGLNLLAAVFGASASAPAKSPTDGKIICTAGEWYLFPSHFFVPSNLHSVGFIEGNFHGLLPRYFPTTNVHKNGTLDLGTSVVAGTAFNDMNKEVRARYLNLYECDALVLVCDLKSDGTPFLPAFIDKMNNQPGSNWRTTLWSPVLDQANSPSSVARAFYIPNYSPWLNKYKAYALLERQNPKIVVDN
jgi:hypothetical protein